MKNLFYGLFLLLLCFTACEQSDIVTEAGFEELVYEEIDDANNLAAELPEAESRSAKHRITSVSTSADNYITLDANNCYDRYEGYAKFPVDTPVTFTIEGTGFGDRTNSWVEVRVLKDRQTAEVLSWTDTAIVVSVTNRRRAYKNVLLKFRVYIDDNFRRKSIRCVSGLEMEISENGVVNTIEAYYPSASWEFVKSVFIFNSSATYEKLELDAKNYRPIDGDILLVQENGRAAYVKNVSTAVDRNGYSKFYVSERNRNCNGRVGINKIYQLQDGVIQAREAEVGQGMFDVLYRGEEAPQ